MALELEKNNVTLKINLQECTMTDLNNRQYRSVTGTIISFDTKVWDDGGVTATLGLTDNDENYWIRYNPVSWFGLKLHNKLLNIYGKPVVKLKVWTSKDVMTDRKYLNPSIEVRDVEITNKYEKVTLNDVPNLVEEMKHRYGKAGQPKHSDETEPEYVEQPEPATMNTGFSKEVEKSNDDKLPF